MNYSISHTFIILAYKESIYLEDCIKSLLAQTVKSEIIISTFTPSRLLEDFSEKYNIPIIINDSNTKGIASDWNFAYRNCKSDYLTLAHQDDIYLPDYTKSFLNYIKNKPSDNILILFSAYKDIIDNRIRRISLNSIVKSILLFPFLFTKRINCRFFKKLILSFGNPIGCPAVMYHRKFINDFEFSDKYNYNLDWDAWLRLASLKGSFVYLKKYLMLHRLHKESETSMQISDNRRFEEEKMIFQGIWGKPLGSVISYLFRSGAQSNKV